MKYSEMKISCEIFCKYVDDWFESDHDIIYGPSIDTPFSREDEAKLKLLGWSKSDSYDCWTC